MKSKFTKAELKQYIVPGAWVQVRWDDTPDAIDDTVELVIGAPDWSTGGLVDVVTYNPKVKGHVYGGWVTHDQIVYYWPAKKAPKPNHDA